MNELRPCPFCGNEPQGNIWHTYGKKPYDETLYFCANPKCREFMKKAIPLEQWNTRPIEDELLDRIAELEEKQRWRVVANGELPEDGEVVWLWDGKYIGMGYYLVFTGQFMDRYTPLRPIRPSHWMPLPEPPNDTQTGTFVYGKVCE